MKLNFFLILPFTAVLGGLVERNGQPGCDSDNCARAVTGTRLGSAAVSTHMADCASFQQVTTYLGSTTVAPTATPAYASACTGAGDSYASACSCWGFPVQTVTLYPHSDDGGRDDVIEWEPVP